MKQEMGSGASDAALTDEETADVQRGAKLITASAESIALS